MSANHVEPGVDREPRPGECEPDLDPTSRASDWIDPEGDDWLALIYRELAGTSDPGLAADTRTVELAPWFG